MWLRSEQPGDADAIAAVHTASFPTDAEARLVSLLRSRGRLAVSLVAAQDAEVIGHIGFSPVTVACGRAGLGLAPLAVLEAFRRQSVGARLVEAGLAACRSLGCGWVVVLGEPAYYGRFGFQQASAVGLVDEYGGGDAFQVLELQPGGLPQRAGLVQYAPEFASLSS